MGAKLRVVGAVGIFFACSSLAMAQGYTATYSEDATYNSFTRLENTSDDNSVGECAATSIMNSFMYLETKYPSVYGNKLTGGLAPTMANVTSGSIGAVRDTLHGNITMSTSGLQGGVYTAKMNWISMNAPGTTSVVGITSLASSNAVANGYSSSTAPGMTFGASGSGILAFLTAQIKAGEDVEIGLYGHMMTLTSVGMVTGTMTPEIEYIDPNSPGSIDAAVLGTNRFGQYTITIPGGYGPPIRPRSTIYSNTSPIYYAFAESPLASLLPVPEPSALMAILGLGGMGLFYYARRRQKGVLAAMANGSQANSA